MRFIFNSVQAWYEGFFAAAMGVGVLVGEYYILTIGYRWVKSRIERLAAERGIDCWVQMNSTSIIQFKHPQNVSPKQKVSLQSQLFLYVLVLILCTIIWLGLVVLLGMKLFNITS